jgi:coenzyme F420 hydrogenase subunit delta
LNEKKPRLILIVDAIDKGRTPGEIFEIDLDDIPKKKVDDFSMHQMPSSNLLKELQADTKINIRILVVQVKYIPPEIEAGLSEELKAVIGTMCDRIISILGEYGVDVKRKVE